MTRPSAQVVVVADDQEGAEVLPAGHGLPLRVVKDPRDALAYVSDLRDRAIPAVLVLGRRDLNSAAVIMEARRQHPELAVVVATFDSASRQITARAAARPSGSPALVAEIRSALRAATQQARVRTTLDRLNIRLRREELVPDPRQQEALVLSRLYLSNFIEQAQDGMFITDRSGAIALWNPAASRLFGGAVDAEMTGRRIDEASAGAAGAALLDGVRRVSADQPSVSLSLQVATPDAARELDVSLSLVCDPEGRGVAVSGIVRDVTERQTMLRELQARAAALEASSRHKDEFLAVLSHELRTPLNAVLGWAQILLTSPYASEQYTRGLQTIARNAELQRRLVEDLLDFARIAAGRFVLECEPTDIIALARTAADAARPAIVTRKLRLVEEYEPGLVAEIDQRRIRQVLSNLLANAVKFTEPEGVIRFSACRVAEGIRIRVADTGRGISPEFLPHVFDHFKQEDASTTRTESGVGLGLAISRRIVELHRGRITAESEGLNRGAVFTVTLPAGAAGAPQPDEPRQGSQDQ